MAWIVLSFPNLVIPATSALNAAPEISPLSSRSAASSIQASRSFGNPSFGFGTRSSLSDIA